MPVSVADLGGGARDAPPPLWSKISSFSYSFWENWPNNRLAPPPLGLAPPPLVNPRSATEFHPKLFKINNQTESTSVSKIRLTDLGFTVNSFVYPTHLSSMYHINSTISVSIYSHFYQLSITISFHHKNTISNHRLLNEAINPSFTWIFITHTSPRFLSCI